MGYILLGHGGLDLTPGAFDARMEWVAVPQGTTIQFYADTGQGLVYGSDDLDVWSQLQAPWPAIDSTRVAYNLTLYSARELWDEELKNDPDFGGHTLLRAGVDGVPDPIQLCTGTPDTCPTDPRAVAAGATHGCDGILGTYTGDLYWLACTSLSGASKSTENEVRGGAAGDVVMGQGPDFVPGDQDFDAVAAVNRANVKDTDDGDSVTVDVGGYLALVGDGHDERYQWYVDFFGDKETGQVTVRKGRMFGAGTLEVSGISPSKQGVVEAALNRFSDKDVEFV